MGTVPGDVCGRGHAGDSLTGGVARSFNPQCGCIEAAVQSAGEEPGPHGLIGGGGGLYHTTEQRGWCGAVSISVTLAVSRLVVARRARAEEGGEGEQAEQGGAAPSRK